MVTPEKRKTRGGNNTMSHVPVKHLSAQKSVEDLASEMQAAAARLPRLIGDLGKRHAEILSRMKEIEEAGLIYATPYWRAEKYLYLIYPMKGGGRRRDYIGADPHKIKDALEAVKRVEEYEHLSEKLRRLERSLSRARYEMGPGGPDPLRAGVIPTFVQPGIIWLSVNVLSTFRAIAIS
jgi:hypothetical protein